VSAGAEFIKKYGWIGLAYVAVLGLILAVVVWLSAHSAAAPGTQVSVMWGLVNYTKPHLRLSSPDRNSQTPPRQASEPADSHMTKGPLDLFMQPDLQPDRIQDILKSRRAAANLRPLSLPEAGRPLSQMPLGTYCYVYGLYFGSSFVSFAESLEHAKMMKNHLKVDAEMVVEVHHPMGGRPLLHLFFDDVTAAMIARLPGDKTISASAALRPSPKWDTLVVVPVDRINSALNREAQDDDGYTVRFLDLVLQ
jgi:hypothetical protein